MYCADDKDLISVVKSLHKTCRTLWNNVDNLVKLVLKRSTSKRPSFSGSESKKKVWKRKSELNSNSKTELKADVVTKGNVIAKVFEDVKEKLIHVSQPLKGKDVPNWKNKRDGGKKEKTSKMETDTNFQDVKTRKGLMFRNFDRVLTRFRRDEKKVILEHEAKRLGLGITTFHGMKSGIIDKYMITYDSKKELDFDDLMETWYTSFQKVVKSEKENKEMEFKRKKILKRVKSRTLEKKSNSLFLITGRRILSHFSKLHILSPEELE